MLFSSIQLLLPAQNDHSRGTALEIPLDNEVIGHGRLEIGFGRAFEAQSRVVGRQPGIYRRDQRVEAVGPGFEGRVRPDEIEDPPSTLEIGHGSRRGPVYHDAAMAADSERFQIVFDESRGIPVSLDEDGTGGSPGEGFDSNGACAGKEIEDTGFGEDAAENGKAPLAHGIGCRTEFLAF